MRKPDRAPGESDASLIRLFLAFLRLGLTAFGGPAMVAYIRELAMRRRWLSESAFQEGVALVQSIPGATAMQMAAFVGLRTRGIKGALATYTAFGLPAFLLMLALSVLYSSAYDLPRIVSLFAGLQVIVVAIVANATWSFGRNLVDGVRVALIAATAAILFGLGVSPFLVIAGAALSSVVIFRSGGAFQATRGRTVSTAYWRGLALLLILLAAGLAGLYLADPARFRLTLLMLRIDLFAFGGGFASLPLMLHEVVAVKGWLDSQTFMNGIAMGQVTPGPIVITATFIGYLVFGLSGALIATVAIFTPSFLVLVAVAPVFDRIKGSEWFGRATRGILASFVGLLFFVTIKFALAVSWDWLRVLMAAGALGALVRKVDILYVVLAGAAVSILFIR